MNVFFVCFLLSVFHFALSYPEKSKWDFPLSGDGLNKITVAKSLFKGAEIIIRINCEHTSSNENVTITWELAESICWQDFLLYAEGSAESNAGIRPFLYNESNCISSSKTYPCNGHFVLDEYQKDNEGRCYSKSKEKAKRAADSEGQSVSENVLKEADSDGKEKTSTTKDNNAVDHSKIRSSRLGPVYTIGADGIYVLTLSVESSGSLNMSVYIEIQGKYGYLSAADWPLLPFYGAMCLVYVVLGLAWLIVSFCQWRDLLRIQFWIGGVILLGMLEKATFYAAYQSINSSGMPMRKAMLLAELVSCAKRTLARMLVIIVSLGFGIVKPRLGAMLHRVIGTGILYFILASIECYLRVMHLKNDPTNQIFIASIPLAVLDSAICWWIFTSLIQTMRTLRLRRNVVKLSLYRHFTNTLIFSVISSVIFMLYSVKYHRGVDCLTDWKELWVDEAYWHLLFSVLLLVIMILWRPTNNNQRFAFTPLLDDEEDDEEEQFVNDAFGVNIRKISRNNSPKERSPNNEEDDLKWVEENIPSSITDMAMPILDSDEEAMTTEFEKSKMR